MIAVDTSALMAIVLDEPTADACMKPLKMASKIIISAATVAEALIAAGRRDAVEVMARLIDELGVDVIPVTPEMAQRVAKAYAAWGKGVHAARLNFGDCFSYAVAKDHACPLLFVGDDFAKTDIERVI